MSRNPHHLHILFALSHERSLRSGQLSRLDAKLEYKVLIPLGSQIFTSISLAFSCPGCSQKGNGQGSFRNSPSSLYFTFDSLPLFSSLKKKLLASRAGKTSSDIFFKPFVLGLTHSFYNSKVKNHILFSSAFLLDHLFIWRILAAP